MPRRPEQYEQLRAEKKQLIIKTALNLFANEGFHTTSISKIASAAKMSKGLLYNYFDSKESLLKEIALSGFDEILTGFDSNHDGYLSDEEFETFINDTFRLVQEKKEHWKLYYRMVMQPEAMKYFWQAYEKMNESFLAPLLDFFSRKGYEEPEAEIQFFYSVFEGAFIQYLFSPIEFQLEPVRKRLINLYLEK